MNRSLNTNLVHETQQCIKGVVCIVPTLPTFMKVWLPTLSTWHSNALWCGLYRPNTSHIHESLNTNLVHATQQCIKGVVCIVPTLPTFMKVWLPTLSTRPSNALGRGLYCRNTSHIHKSLNTNLVHATQQCIRVWFVLSQHFPHSWKSEHQPCARDTSMH